MTTAYLPNKYRLPGIREDEVLTRGVYINCRKTALSIVRELAQSVRHLLELWGSSSMSTAFPFRRRERCVMSDMV